MVDHNHQPSSSQQQEDDDELIILRQFEKVWDEQWWKIGWSTGFLFNMTMKEIKLLSNVYFERWPMFVVMSGISFFALRRLTTSTSTSSFATAATRTTTNSTRRTMKTKSKSPFQQQQQQQQSQESSKFKFMLLLRDGITGLLFGGWSIIMTQDDLSLDQRTSTIPFALKGQKSGISDNFCNVIMEEYHRQWLFTPMSDNNNNNNNQQTSRRRDILINPQNKQLQPYIHFAKNCYTRYQMKLPSSPSEDDSMEDTNTT